VAVRPSLKQIETHVRRQVPIKELFLPGAIDDHHVLLRFSTEEDFLKVYMQNQWKIAGRAMMVARWSPSFHPGNHSPCIPVWVGFPLLRAHLQSPSAIKSIASTVGKVLKIHDNVKEFTRPGFASVCIEVDFSKPLKTEIRIQNGEETFYQPVVFPEPIPSYCNLCGRLGHMEENCRSNPANYSIPVNNLTSETHTAGSIPAEDGTRLA
jgi:hypothetical protein